MTEPCRVTSPVHKTNTTKLNLPSYGTHIMALALVDPLALLITPAATMCPNLPWGFNLDPQGIYHPALSMLQVHTWIQQIQPPRIPAPLVNTPISP